MNFKDQIKNVKTFQDFCTLCDHLENSKQKGTFFETLCKFILLIHPNFNNKHKNVWLYDEIPPSVKDDIKIPEKDKGIDILIENDNGVFICVQCKYRSDINNVVSYSDLSTFFSQLYLASKIKNGIYMTNTIENCDEITKSSIVCFNYDFFDSLNTEFFKCLHKYLENHKKPVYKKLVLRDPQKKCIESVLESFKTCDRNHIIMPCGLGKSITSFYIDKTMNNKKTLILVPSLYLLSQIYSSWVKESFNDPIKYKYLLIGSDYDQSDKIITKSVDCTTDINLINQFYKNVSDKNKNKYIIISTYQSSKLLSDKEFDLIIFDEAHKTVGQDSYFSFALHDKNIIGKKRFFMTATKRVYKTNGSDSSDINSEDSEDSEDIISMDNENLYGSLVYEYTLREAIDNGYLCDYQLECMLINDKTIQEYKDNNKLIHLEANDKNYYKDTHNIATAFMIKSMFDNNKIKHLLTYHSSINNSKQFAELLNSITGIKTFHIDGSYISNKRYKIIKEFVETEKAIITSSKVLNEGIDIPIVDSVCFVDGRKSQIDIIQCIGRSLRSFGLQKMAKILIPMEENELKDDKLVFGHIISILKTLKIYDYSIVDYFVAKKYDQNPNKQLIKYSSYNNISFEKVFTNVDFKALENGISSKIIDIIFNWENTLQKYIEFVEKNKKKSNKRSKDIKEKRLGEWFDQQIKYYKQNKNGMKDPERRKKWEEFMEKYKEYLLTNDEIWIDMSQKAVIFFEKYKKRPNKRSKDVVEKRLGHWISQQITQYAQNKNGMKDLERRKKWKEFVEKNKEYLFTKEELWIIMLQKVVEFIEKYKKRSNKRSENIEEKTLGKWLTRQIQNYKNNDRGMKDPERRKIWEEFVEKHKEYFKH
jgi:predicted helicase